jgi:type VI secretion system FHA domain protein
MRMTHLRVADNNPLKFSVDVNDALHNLLVKRNQAYLSPVESFEDAFQDLRHHQIAMLAGMRVAFEFMLAEFDPDRLEEQFGRRIEKSALMGKSVRQLRSWRYWEMYRDKQVEMARDPEASFRKLFGEAFAKAYEEQLERLRTQR